VFEKSDQPRFTTPAASQGSGSSAPDLPLVTVFVACYNHARFVVQALESVRIQDYPRIQRIVSDDRSKDDSVRVLGDWLGRHWSLSRQKFCGARGPTALGKPAKHQVVEVFVRGVSG
jgi:cellulose synthase/poly-beta-1,6-N-acetylglucosamine synthase-like glycosyltransferase